MWFVTNCNMYLMHPDETGLALFTKDAQKARPFKTQKEAYHYAVGTEKAVFVKDPNEILKSWEECPDKRTHHNDMHSCYTSEFYSTCCWLRQNNNCTREF